MDVGTLSSSSKVRLNNSIFASNTQSKFGEAFTLQKNITVFWDMTSCNLVDAVLSYRQHVPPKCRDPNSSNIDICFE